MPYTSFHLLSLVSSPQSNYFKLVISSFCYFSPCFILSAPVPFLDLPIWGRSEEHTSELQSQWSISYAVFC